MMKLDAFADRYLSDLKNQLNRFDTGGFSAIVEAILDAYAHTRRIFVMGNGGSASTASHFACDINKGCCIDLEHKFKMICLNDSLPTLMAIANDLSYASVFVEQLKNFFEPKDLVIGISGSGNSPNVIAAIDYARLHGAKTIGLSGFDGGTLAKSVDIAWVAGIQDMQKVEDLHMIVVHMIMQAVFAALHPAPTRS